MKRLKLSITICMLIELFFDLGQCLESPLMPLNEAHLRGARRRLKPDFLLSFLCTMQEYPYHLE